MFQTLKSWLKPTPATRPESKTRLGVQTLEAREVPYAAVSLGYFEGYYLCVTGTSGADEIAIQKVPGFTEVRHSSAGDAVTRVDRFPDSLNLQDIQVSGGGGDDAIRNDTNLPITAWGGSGNDSLRTTGGRGTFDGGTGHDNLYGGPLNDSFTGGDGNDYLFGSSGNDVLRGCADNDYLAGDSGNDKLYGGTGRDQLYGYAGDDWLDAGILGGPYAPDIVDGGTGIDLNAQVLVVNGIRMTDVVQGGGPTCWIASAVASVALREPECLTNAVRYVGEDTFEVRLYNSNRQLVTQQVAFNGDRLGADMPLSATSAETAEFWQIIWQRGYLMSRGISIGTQGGGNSMDVLTALTGRASNSVGPASYSGYLPESAWDTMNAALTAGKNVTAMTWADDVLNPFGNMKRSTDILVGWHAYTVLSTFVDNAGEKYVWLRNPWGVDGGTTVGNADDGVVCVRWSDFKRSMCEIDVN